MRNNVVLRGHNGIYIFILPASFHWDKFNGDKSHDDSLIDQMIDALNNSEPAVFALMDYWTFDGWFKLKLKLMLQNE